jgi:hypothetical protein
MVDYTDSLGFTKNAAAIPAFGYHRFGYIQVELDFAAIAAARTAAGVAALGVGDTLEILKLPANTCVIAVGADVTKAEGATSTGDLGDSGSATRYFSNLNLNAVAHTPSSLDAPHVYATETGIIMTMDHAAHDTGVMRYWFLVLDVQGTV